MQERVAWYEKHGISKWRYVELKGIARQYAWMKAEEKKLRRGEVDRPEGGNGAWRRPDPVGNAAVDMAMRSYAPRIRAIEEAAKAADPLLWKYILRNVCDGVSWEKLGPPCGCRQFHARRRLFFLELHCRLPAC